MVWHALRYASIGIPVFPCKADKAPLTEHGFKDATTDAEAIRAWWKRWPKALIGMPGGAISGYVVIDIDPRNGGDFDELIARYSDLPHTRQAATPSGGIHLWYKAPPGVPLPKDNSGKIGPGVDFIGDGAYVVIPPSVRPDGEYVWLDERECAELPASIIAAVQRPKPQPVTSATPARKRGKPSTSDSQPTTGNAADYWLDWALEQARDGTSDRVGYLLAIQLYLSRGNPDIEGTLRRYAAQASYDVHKPFTDRDISRWLTSAQASDLVRRGEPARSAQPQPARPPISLVERRAEYSGIHSGPDDEPPAQPPETGIHNTDTGNARRFVRRHGGRVRHVAAWDKWLIWDGTRWQPDETGEVERLAQETVMSIYSEAADCADEAERKELAKWAMRSEADNRIKAMLSRVKSQPEIALASDQLDADPWLLNCRNGTLDLRSCELREHRQHDLCTKRAEVDYEPEAPAPTWAAFLDRIFAGDAALIAFVQRSLGYSLTCDTSEQCVFIPFGGGANGKSTFLETVGKALGDYALTTPTETLMEKRGQSIPSDVARLKGARFVSASESGDGKRLDEELIKRMTGGDQITARFMHRDWFTFTPVLKLWLAVNHRPKIQGTDNGIWRRIRLIPFEVTIPTEQQDKRLTRKLRAEWAGILAWMVRGCLDWQRDGLGTPDKVLQATQDYREDMDTIGRFIADRCLTLAQGFATSRALFDTYSKWCEANGERPLSAHRLGAYLRDNLGCKPDRDTHANRGWRGIGIRFEGEV